MVVMPLRCVAADPWRTPLARLFAARLAYHILLWGVPMTHDAIVRLFRDGKRYKIRAISNDLRAERTSAADHAGLSFTLMEE